MLIVFLLIGCSVNGHLDEHTKEIILAALALMFSYVSATSINDIADRKIDSINHSGKPGRPLVSKIASEQQMWTLFVISSVGSLILSALIGVYALFILFFSIIINITYSLKPLRISYRTFLAPFYLGIAYVCLPFVLGLYISDSGFTTTSIIWITSLYLLFISRIVLKDFRDRKGDSKYGKPTLLLKYGKKATCVVSLIALTLGCLAMLVAVNWYPLMLVSLSIYYCLILYCLLSLLSTEDTSLEQLYIGVGAKMGNGLLLALLAYLTLINSNANNLSLITGIVIINAMFVYNFFILVNNPKVITVGYKG